jgi:phosphate transport system substrate-binding protein
VALTIATALAALSWTVALAPSPARAAGGLVATPGVGLTDGQFVKLAFSGFAPSSGISFRQCIAGPVTIATDCTAANQQVTGVTDDNGAGTTYLPVYAGTDQLLENDGRTGTILCDQAHPCVIAGFPPGSTLSTAVLASISFGPSPDACPPPSADSVLGSGSSSAYRAIYQWESTVCQPPANLSVGYTVSNSEDGVSNFLAGLTQFGVSGPFPPPAPAQGAQTFRFAPLTTSALVLGYRMYDRRGPQITSLTLTPDLIAQIFLGEVSNWNVNAAIQALNPGIEFPSREVTFARAEHSAQTFVFTSWLAAAAPATWTPGPAEIFPLPPSGVVGVTGNVGPKVVDPTTDFTDQGNIGFMDSSSAAFYGLPTVQIKRPDGSVVAATRAAITQAIADATVNADGTITTNYTNADPAAYPMPMPTYMMAPTNTISPDAGTTLAAFLRYAVQTGQANEPPGYAPLPANLVNDSMEVAAAIPAPAPSTPTPSPASVHVAQTPPPQNPTLPKLPPLPSAAATATPCALGSPAASPSPSSSPSPSCAAASAVTHHKGVPPTPSAQQRAEIAGLVRASDPTATRYILPSVATLAVIGLAFGPLVQGLARRRRLLAT